MRKKISQSFFVVMLTLSVNAFAQTTIGVVDLEGVIVSSNAAQQELANLQSNPEYKKLKSEIETLQSELQALQKKGETQSLTWSQEQKNNHVKQGQAVLSQYNQLVNREASIKQNLMLKLQNQLSLKVEEIVNNIINEKGIDLLLDVNSVQFRAPSLDITREVVQKLNDAK